MRYSYIESVNTSLATVHKRLLILSAEMSVEMASSLERSFVGSPRGEYIPTTTNSEQRS